MAFSKVVIDFTTVPDINEELQIDETLMSLALYEIFVTQRLASLQTKRPNYAVDHFNGFVSTNYRNAFVLDHNATGLFTVSYTTGADGSGIGTVTITATYHNAVFIEGLTPVGTVITITNEATVPEYEITEQIFEQASEQPCDNVSVSVETDGLTTDILEPLIVSGNTDNPFTFDYLRGQTFNLKIRDASGSEINQSITTPPFLNSANFSLTINNSPYGATAIVTNVNSDGLALEYSLDGVVWQTENSFPSLEVDDYTLSVRDQYGCSFTQSFSVNDNAIYIPSFYISKSNAIRYAERVTFGDAINYPTDENTLSCEAPFIEYYNRFKEIQLFQTADIVPTQFKSNYSTHTVTAYKTGFAPTNIPVVKKSSNIGVTDKRDAIKYDRGNGKTGIYFISGNIYDYNTNAIIDTYSLNGYLPLWAVAGNYISLGASFFLIEDVIFDESKNAEVVIIDNIYTGLPTPQIVGCIYNVFPYEVYEYYIDMVDFIDSSIRVKLEATDPNFPTITYLSEEISVKVRHADTIAIRYRNSDNTDIFYSTGIEFLIRQEIISITAVSVEEFTNNKTDTNVVLIDGDVYEADEFDFEPVTKELFRKITRALSHEFVYLDDVGYVKNDNVDFEKLGASNAYNIKAKMIKTGNVYNAQAFGISAGVYNGENVNIPGLVDYGDGFVKYQ